MADRKISDLTALTTPAAGDYLPIIDISEPLAANKNKRITIEELLRGAPDGTAGAPGFAFESDPDSGLYSTGANSVALSTGGTGRLFVDASGKVGVGTASPSYVLDVLGSARVKTGATATPFIISTGGDSQGTVRFGSASTEYSINGGADYLGLIFNSNGSERLRITSTGQLSHIGAGSTGSPAVSFNGSAPSNSLVITSAGLVGIGTSSPGSLLSVKADNSAGIGGTISIINGAANASGNATRLLFQNSSSFSPSFPSSIIESIQGSATNCSLAFRTYTDGVGAVERLRIDSAGRVGIGSTTFSAVSGISGAKLQVLGGTIIGNDGASSNGSGWLAFDSACAAPTTSKPVIYHKAGTGLGIKSDYEINFEIGASDAVKIDNNRRLLVGTSSARQGFFNGVAAAPQFEVEGLGLWESSAAFINNENATGGHGVVLARSRGTSKGSFTIVQNNDAIGGIYYQGADGTDFVEAARIVCEVDGTPGANDMPGRLVFSTTADGASSPTERLRITSAGLVGIGTSSPATLLEVRSATTNAARLRVTGTGTTAGNFRGYEFGNGSVFKGGLLQDESTDLISIFTPVGGQSVNITSAGSVGIGTTSPARALDVNGSIQLPSNQALYISGSSNYLYADSTATELGSATKIVFTANGSQRATIDSSGRLLVGTSSARAVGFSSLQAPVQVETTTAAAYTGVNNTNDANGCYVSIAKTRGTSAGAVTAVQNNDELGAIRISGSDGTGFVVGAQILAAVDGTPGTNDLPTRLVFSVTRDGQASPTPTMLIGNSGQIGTFTSNYGIEVATAQSAGTVYTLFTARHSASGFFGGTISFLVYSNGNVVNTNNSYGAISDIKLKENIVDANSQWDDIKALQVRNYNFKEGQTHTQIGLIAQEVELVSPGLVSESPDRDAEGNDLGTVTKSINYSVLYMKAVKALQEAMERIETLEQRLNDAGIN